MHQTMNEREQREEKTVLSHMSLLQKNNKLNIFSITPLQIEQPEQIAIFVNKTKTKLNQIRHLFFQQQFIYYLISCFFNKLDLIF